MLPPVYLATPGGVAVSCYKSTPRSLAATTSFWKFFVFWDFMRRYPLIVIVAAISIPAEHPDFVGLFQAQDSKLYVPGLFIAVSLINITGVAVDTAAMVQAGISRDSHNALCA